ncbi:putative bifunctional diguanylate cyclase/phosphodiesterase [Deinococcus budaensis]|uniref:Diguanylate cyclase (GGDEF)-like protein n=1 Tax=Deinococcus budaensis TaxID=1665626 RepID=A0A7W8LP06_9DEIO|nr:EAL domain-containing protein [Deinococcus budaensis]MBB5233149.1 diguanylate cyclase (GGDEF)-like protein [Deinococcus budaensis]
MPRAWRSPLTIAAVYLAAWWGLDAAAQRFETAPGISVWYPPTALDYVLLLAFGLRFWPLLLLSGLLHQLLTVPEPLPPLPLLVFVVGTALVHAGACALLLRVWQLDVRLPRLRDVGLFVGVAVLAAPLAAAALQVLNLTLGDLLTWSKAPVHTLQLWAGIATGVGMLAPPLLLALRPLTQARLAPLPDELQRLNLHPQDFPAQAGRWARWRRGLEGLGELALIGLALWVGYGGPRSASLDYSYVLFVPLLWIAARHGFGRAVVAVLLLNVGVALLTRESDVERSGGLALQFGLLTVTLAGLLLGAVMRERQRLTAHLRHLALHDPLTGLGNRRLFNERLGQALAGPAAPRRTLAVILMDFDNFKAINDSLGHAAGDLVLRVVGERLRGCVRPGDVVARLGGDEFALLLEDLHGPGEASEVAGRLLGALEDPVPVPGGALRVGASVGIALRGPGAQDSETLLRNADVALYHAKARHRGRAQLFDAAMHASVLERLELEADLRVAIARGGFEIHYQPLVELQGGELRGFEALVRWRHPARGLLGPCAFIPLAEETGLIVAIDRWVLRAACAEVASWPQPAGRPPVSLGVNLTATHLHSPDVVQEVQSALQASGLAPERLMLELTENVLLSDTAASAQTLRELRGLGLRLALDDFGTGYSSLGYLREFPISDLKVDRSFVTNLGQDGAATELARMVAVLGRTLGLATVAEGVETPEHYAQVRELGYTLAQGYHIGRPLPAEQARALALQEAPLVPPG